MNVKIAKLPPGLDPADTILQKGPEEWKKIVDGAQQTGAIDLNGGNVTVQNGGETFGADG